MARDERLTGVLLVGGASTRFGSSKALARLGAETLAERAWRTLGEACEERLAVGKASDRPALPFPIVDDGLDVRAPMAGVVAGLRVAGNDLCIFLPVDCPLVTPALLQALAEGCADVDAAVPQTGPLPAAYRQTALPVLERRLGDGRLALREALDELVVRRIDCDETLLVNVNTPEELERLAGE